MSLNFHISAASGPATPDSTENIAQHLSPESSRKAYFRTWDGTQHVPQSPNVFSEHTTGSNMSPSSLGHLKSPAPGRTRSVSDSSAPRRGKDKENLLSTLPLHMSNETKQQIFPSKSFNFFRFSDKNLNSFLWQKWEGCWSARVALGDTGGVRHQPEAAHRSDEHEQRHGKQHVCFFFFTAESSTQ